MKVFRWLRRRHLDDLSEEIRSHLEEKTDALIATGLARADAEREARRAFGNVMQVKEAAGDVWRLGTFLDNVATDTRHALRGLIQKPGYTVTVILTLALGIGANAVVFALVNAVVLRPLPYPDADRIISVSQTEDGRDRRVLHDFPYAEWVHATRTVESHAAYQDTQAVLNAPEGSSRIAGPRATPSYFGMFGVTPLMGRTFDETEALPGGPQVVVLSEPLWRERFGGDAATLGRIVTMDGIPRQVIGILPAAFTYGRTERFWIPFRVAPVRQPPGASGELFAYAVVARLRPSASLEGVRVELVTVMGRLAQQGFGRSVGTPVVMTLHERRHGETTRPLLLLFGAVGVLLLTACANIANLALARASRREREFALRLALGASRWRIVRFVLIENLALAAGGALLGLLTVSASLGWFVRISPGSIQSVDTIGVSGALIAYASVVAILTALLFGLVPALTASRAAPHRTLASGTPHAAGSRRQSFARRALVAGELAIALVFLTGAGLVAKTFWRVTSVDPGFRPEHVLTASFEVRANRYTDATAAAFFDDLMSRVRREPGVVAAAYAQGAPMTGGDGGAIVVDGRRRLGEPPRRRSFRLVAVDPAYFETIGARLVGGRFISSEDRAGAPRVAVVTEEYGRLNLDGAPALGRTAADGRTIVGVVKDIAQEATDGERHPLEFTPLAQTRGRLGLGMVVKTTG